MQNRYTIGLHISNHSGILTQDQVKQILNTALFLIWYTYSRYLLSTNYLLPWKCTCCFTWLLYFHTHLYNGINSHFTVKVLFLLDFTCLLDMILLLCFLQLLEIFNSNENTEIEKCSTEADDFQICKRTSGSSQWILGLDP